MGNFFLIKSDKYGKIVLSIFQGEFLRKTRKLLKNVHVIQQEKSTIKLFRVKRLFWSTKK